MENVTDLSPLEYPICEIQYFKIVLLLALVDFWFGGAVPVIDLLILL